MADPEKKPEKKKKPQQKQAKGGKKSGPKDGGKKKEAKKKPVYAKVPSRLKARLREEIAAKLKERLGYDNVMALPHIEKITVSMGVGAAAKDKDGKSRLEAAAKDLTTITAQRPKITRSRKAVAGFALRPDQPVGLMVTLRGDRMYDFFDRLVSVAIPRVRDFAGLSRGGFDDGGSYSLGITEQAVFPEIDINQVQHTQGMNITINVRSRKKEDAVALLEEMGLPLQKS